MEKREFVKDFARIKGKYEKVSVSLKNTDVVYSDDYQFDAKDRVLWLLYHNEKICLTELKNIFDLW